MPSFVRQFLVAVCLLGPSLAWADQPIFDEMPRWKDGWGVQFLHEFRRHATQYDGTEVVEDPAQRDVHILNIEGVYTWDKSIRATIKVPAILETKTTRTGADGRPEDETLRGLGDVTLAVPLKKYFNLDGRSGSWTFAPQLRIPGTRAAENTTFFREWGAGVGAGYETETNAFIVGGSVSGWSYFGNAPWKVGADAAVGLNFQFGDFNGHLKWKNHLHHWRTGTVIYRAGPRLYMRFTDTVHGQILWEHDFYTYRGQPGFAERNTYRVGVGFVY